MYGASQGHIINLKHRIVAVKKMDETEQIYQERMSPLRNTGSGNYCHSTSCATNFICAYYRWRTNIKYSLFIADWCILVDNE